MLLVVGFSSLPSFEEDQSDRKVCKVSLHVISSGSWTIKYHCNSLYSGPIRKYQCLSGRLILVKIEEVFQYIATANIQSDIAAGFQTLLLTEVGYIRIFLPLMDVLYVHDLSSISG